MSDEKSQFTGLILVSGIDTPGITQALFETLAPFAITVLDIEQVVIRERLILTVLIALNPAHAEAINNDLEECGKALGVDIATELSQKLLDSGAPGIHFYTMNTSTATREIFEGIKGAGK